MSLDFDAVSRAQLDRPTSRMWSLDPGSIGAWIAETGFGTAPVVQHALAEAVRDQLYGYLTPAIEDEAAAATSDWYAAEYGWRPDPRRIHQVTDVLSALDIAVRQFSRLPESAVIVPTPASMPFLSLPRTLGRRLLQVPGSLEDGRWVLDLERLDEAFASGGGTLVLGNPHNPTGRMFERQELERISEVVERHGGIVFADEVHAPLRFSGEHIPCARLSVATAAHTITATSASKGWNIPGVKAAQLILSNELHEQRFQADGVGHLHEASTLGVIAGTAAYRHGGEWLADVRGSLDRNRRLFAGLLAPEVPEIAFTLPEATYLGWLDCSALELPEAPAQYLRTRAGVTLTAGALCGRGFEQYVRLVFATRATILRDIVASIGEAVRDRRVPLLASPPRPCPDRPRDEDAPWCGLNGVMTWSRRATVAGLAAASVGLALSACSSPTAASAGSSTRHAYGDHRSQFGELSLPKSDPSSAAVVVLLHGGYWQSQYGLGLMRPIAADIVARGHVVWNLEYRRVGTDGGGWPETLADVAAGIDLLADPGLGLDLTRVVAVGHSAGGQLAAWAASRPGLPSSAPGADPTVPLTGVVSLAGVLDLRAGQQDGLGGGAVAQLLGGSPADVPTRYADASPIERLPLHVPTRCVHSRTDPLVPYTQSQGFVIAAGNAGDDSRLITVTGDHFAYIDPGATAWKTAARALEALLTAS